MAKIGIIKWEPVFCIVTTFAIAFSKCSPQMNIWTGPELPNESLTFTQLQLNRGKDNWHNSVSMVRKTSGPGPGPGPGWPDPGSPLGFGPIHTGDKAGNSNNNNVNNIVGGFPNSNFNFNPNFNSKSNGPIGQFPVAGGGAGTQEQGAPGGFFQTSFVSSMSPGGGIMIQSNNPPNVNFNNQPPNLCPGFPFCGNPNPNRSPFCAGFPFCGGTPFCPGFPFCKATATRNSGRSMTQVESEPELPANFAPVPGIPLFPAMDPSGFIGNIFTTIGNSISFPSSTSTSPSSVFSTHPTKQQGYFPYKDPSSNLI